MISSLVLCLLVITVRTLFRWRISCDSAKTSSDRSDTADSLLDKSVDGFRLLGLDKQESESYLGATATKGKRSWLETITKVVVMGEFGSE